MKHPQFSHDHSQSPIHTVNRKVQSGSYILILIFQESTFQLKKAPNSPKFWKTRSMIYTHDTCKVLVKCNEPNTVCNGAKALIIITFSITTLNIKTLGITG